MNDMKEKKQTEMDNKPDPKPEIDQNIPVKTGGEQTVDPVEKAAVKKKPTPAPKPKPKPDPRAKLAKLDHEPYIITSSPHRHTSDSVPRIMWNVVAALTPVVIFSIVLFGWLAVKLIAACVATALVTELIVNRIKGTAMTISDGSAAITGLLLALTLPPSLSVTSAMLGVIFAITIGKHVFGGLGYNIFNPALLGRAFLQASFPVAMTTWTSPGHGMVDGISAATPLGQFKFEHIMGKYSDMFFGNIGGSLGETSALLILIGGVYLLVKGYAGWRIPVSYLMTVFVFTSIFWLVDRSAYPDPLFYMLSGGLLLGAFFMATDMVTSPITPKGCWIFGIGAGIVLVIIRLFGGVPEGVMYSILLMNAVTPLLNRFTRPKFFGEISQ